MRHALRPPPTNPIGRDRRLMNLIRRPTLISAFQPSTTSRRNSMSQPERFEVLVLGSGTGGKLVAWHMAQSGRRTAVVERRWIGGSCVNIACMPSKNEIASAKVAHLARHAAQLGTITGPVSVDMATVRRRKREMVDRQIAKHM